MSHAINLLPWREERREQRTHRFYGVVLLMLFMGGFLGWGVAKLYQQQLLAQQQRNAHITTHIEQLDAAIDEVQRYQVQVEQLRERLGRFQSLDHERIHTVQLFNQLAASLVDGVVYQRLSRSAERVSLFALAGNERQVAEQLRQIATMPGLGVPEVSAVASGQAGEPLNFQFDIDQTGLVSPASTQASR